MRNVEFQWCAVVSDAELVELTVSHGGRLAAGWWDRVRRHSLGWVTARSDSALVGFVNVAWDGGDHAFLLDTKSRPDHQRQGIGTAVAALAAAEARRASCEWLHVDFGAELGVFYLNACGFVPTAAVLIRLGRSA